MQVIVTVKELKKEDAHFNPLIPMIKGAMESSIDKLIALEEPPINVDGLVAVHVLDDYEKELTDFQLSNGQKPHMTKLSIGEGHGQVITTADGYHIFLNKYIPINILACQLLEDNSNGSNDKLLNQIKIEKNKYLRVIRHELAHIEDKNNQKEMLWLKDAIRIDNLQNRLRSVAYRLWEEFYACSRSNFYYDSDGIIEEFRSLSCSIEQAEEKACELRWEYNTLKIDINTFVTSFMDYLQTALIYGCYFLGHIDKIYNSVGHELMQRAYPSRIFPHFLAIWERLRAMKESYPKWNSPEILDELADVVHLVIREFEVFPKDTCEGVYYDVPPKKLKTKKQEESEK